MDAYEKMIKVMRTEGNRSSTSYPLRLGTMTGKDSCSVGELELDAEDLMIASHLAGDLGKGDTVLVSQISGELFAVIEKVVTM